jgi:hypothetical protein
MLQCTRILWAVSPVKTRAVTSVSELGYSKGYRMPHRRRLGVRYDRVNDVNRFFSLDILFRRLSGHVGRRQYKMRCDLVPIAEKLQSQGVDWHDLKAMTRDEVAALFEAMKVTPSERVIIMTALQACVCGVIVETERMSSESLCLRYGKKEFGWRCGKDGHSDNIYFENKEAAVPAVLARSRVTKFEENGVAVQLRQLPNFVIEGRLSDVLQPRHWVAPKDTKFNVLTMGYDFKIHPSDPRAQPQITEAAELWEMHAEVVRLVLWELLEAHAVERDPQPLPLAVGDIRPDEPTDYIPVVLGDDDSPIDLRMKDAKGKQRPWFTPAPPRTFVDGIPAHLPFAPSFAVQSVFSFPSGGELTEASLRCPTLKLSCLTHPSSCYWLSVGAQSKVLDELLSYAKRVPYALPFTLYYRVDTARHLLNDAAFLTRRDAQLKEKSWAFDLKNFSSSFR